MWSLTYLISSINVRVNKTNFNRWSFLLRSSGVDGSGEIIRLVLVDRSESDRCGSAFQLSPSEIQNSQWINQLYHEAQPPETHSNRHSRNTFFFRIIGATEIIKEMRISTCGTRLSGERNNRRLWRRKLRMQQRLLRKEPCMHTLGCDSTMPLIDDFNLIVVFVCSPSWIIHVLQFRYSDLL